MPQRDAGRGAIRRGVCVRTYIGAFVHPLALLLSGLLVAPTSAGRVGVGRGGGFLRFCCREARCRASCAHRFGCTVLLGVENRFAKVCCVFRCISRFAGSFERAKRVVGAPCIIHQRQAGQGPCGCLPLLCSPLNCPSTRRFRLGVVYRESVVSRRQSCTGYKVCRRRSDGGLLLFAARVFKFCCCDDAVRQC